MCIYVRYILYSQRKLTSHMEFRSKSKMAVNMQNVALLIQVEITKILFAPYILFLI